MDTPPASEDHTQDQRSLPVPYTQVHDYLRRILEISQDVIVVILSAMLLVMTLQALWRLAQMIVQEHAQLPALLSQIVFVLILAELYRTLIFYLRDHRVSVALIVEVAIVVTVHDLILTGAYEHDESRVFGSALLLVVLGGLLGMERYFGQRSGASDTSAH